MAKILNRVLGAAGVAILVSSLGVLAACGDAAEENTGSGQQAVTNANVAITLYDENGVEVGTGSGVMIAPKTVLTAAHLVAGKGSWKVKSADGKTVVNGIRGQTFDWKRYEGMNAHPRKHDVAVIFTDSPINVAKYPKLAMGVQPAGEQVMRVRGDGKSFQFIESKLQRVKQMPNAYHVSMPANETLDTGGAVINGKGEIVGVVTGRGMQTGDLYIAKVNEVVGWLEDKAGCGGNANNALTVRTVGTPTPKAGCTKDAGSNINGGGSSGGSSGASGSGSSSGSSGGGNGGTCEPGGGYEYPGGGGAMGVSEATGVNGGSQNGSVPGGNGTGGGGGGATTSSSGGSSGTGGGGGVNDGTNGGTNNGTTPGGSSGTGGGGGGATSSSGGSSGGGGGGGLNDGTNGGSTNNSSIPGGGGGAGGAAGLDEEVCEGENDNSDICPPEAFSCEGTCGGAFEPANRTIDYGNSGTGGTNPNSGPIILR